MLEQQLIDLENRAKTILAGICPRITRRTAQYLPPGPGITLDVTAKVRSEQGSAVQGTATVEFWLTAAAKHADSTIAQDWAQITLGYAREKLTAAADQLRELSQLDQVVYEIVANNQAGDEWVHVYRAVQELTLQTQAGGAALAGINTSTITDSPGQHMKARASSALVNLFVSATLDIVGAEIPIVWAHAQQDDLIELLDNDDVVVATYTVTADGPGSASFANAEAGEFRARLRRDNDTLVTSRTTAERIAAQG